MKNILCVNSFGPDWSTAKDYSNISLCVCSPCVALGNLYGSPPRATFFMLASVIAK